MELLVAVVVVAVLALVVVPVFRSALDGTNESVVNASAEAVAREANAAAQFNTGANVLTTTDTNIDAALAAAADAGDLDPLDGWLVDPAANSISLTTAGFTTTVYVCLGATTPVKAVVQSTACAGGGGGGGGGGGAGGGGPVVTVPGAPSIVSVTESSGTLAVTFTAPGDDGGSAISGYEYSTDNGSTWRTRATGTTASPLVISTTSGTNTALANGTTYQVRLRAVNGSGSGQESSAVVSVPYGDPAAPGAPAASSVTTTGMTLTWTAPSDNGGSAITEYRLYLEGEGLWATVSAPTLTYNVTGLITGTNYTWSVVACSVVATGTCSPASSSTTAPTLHGAPSITSVTPGNGQLSVAFTAPTGAASISTYEYSTDNGSTWRTRATGTTASPLVITTISGAANTTLANGTTYQVRLRAVNGSGSGTASTASAGTPYGDPAAPGAPAASSVTTTGMTLTWTAPSDNGGSAITEYRLYLEGEGLWATVSAPTLTYNVTGLITGTNYSWSVVACSVVATGTCSPASSSTTAPTLPASPSVTLTVLSSSSIRVSWSAPAGVTGYRVENASGSTLTSLAAGTTTWDHTGLAAGTSYTYRVFALNGSGASAPGSATATTIPAAPVVATNCPTSGWTITGNCTPSWTAMQGATSYSVTSFGVDVENYTTTSTTGVTLRPSVGSASVGAVVVSVSACNAAGCSSGAVATTSGAPAPSTPSVSWSGEAFGYRTATISGSYAHGYEVEFWHNGGTVWCSTTSNGTDPTGAAFPVGCSDGAGNWTSRYLGYGTHRVRLHAYAQRDTGGTFGGDRTITVAGLSAAIFGSRYAASAYGVNPYHETGWSGYTAQAAAP